MNVHDEGRDPLIPPFGILEDPVPAMCVSSNNPIPDHSAKYIDELKSTPSLVARRMEMSESRDHPSCQTGYGSAWKKLTDMK